MKEWKRKWKVQQWIVKRITKWKPGLYRGFPKLGIPFWAVWIVRIIALGSIFGSAFSGKDHIGMI